MTDDASDREPEDAGEGLPDENPGPGARERSSPGKETPTPRTDADTRHDRVESHRTEGRGNSLFSWTEFRHPLRVAINYAVVVAARHSPSLRAKNWLLRRIGVSVGEGVAWGLESTPDVFWPDRITVGDHAIVGYDATILCHEFLQDELRLGEVVIGDRAMIGAGAILLPGVRVGADARVAANSLVATDVPPGSTVAGVPADVVSEDDEDTRARSERAGERERDEPPTD